MDFCSLFVEAEELEKLGNDDEAFIKYSIFIEKASKVLKDNIENKGLQKRLALAYNNRGFIRYNRVDFNEAVEDYTKSLGYDPTPTFTFYNRGLIHYRLGRFSLAVEDMKKALELDPTFDPALKCLAQSQADLERKKVAQA